MSTTSPRRPAARLALRLLSLALLALALPALASPVAAQTTTTPTDGATPSGLAPGAPAGSFALSGFESVNPYNGNLNFALPLLSIGGRGGAQTGVVLKLDSKGWRFRHFTGTDPNTGVPIDSYIPIQDGWHGLQPGYGPGVLEGRQSGGNTTWQCTRSTSAWGTTLTRLTFTASDGTEYELRDRQTGGQPLTNNDPCNATPPSRGTVFVTGDGSAATFLSDAPISDRFSTNGGGVLAVSGYLMLRDGTRYRIDGGTVTWVRDRNGNKLSYSYVGGRVTAVTDSLQRQVTVTYADFSTVFYDQITYKGFGGVTRTIRVNYSLLGSALRAGYSVQTYAGLFPGMNGSSSSYFNPWVVSSVTLPDNRQYQLLYDSYAELARVVMPTGGAIEYDHTPGAGTVSDGVDYQVYRRVTERRVYPDGSTLEGKTTFTSTSGGNAVITVDQLDAGGALKARSKHYYYGDPEASLFKQGIDYPGYAEGREYQSEDYDTNGTTVLRRVNTTWQNGVIISPWDTSIPNNPRAADTTTTLADTNQVSKQTFTYDDTVPFNNRTDVYEYDFGSGAPGALVRRTHTDYVKTNVVGGTTYDYACDPATTCAVANINAGVIHLRALPKQVSVYDAAGVEQSRTTFEYDNYTATTNHAALIPHTDITGLDAAFTASYKTRGNSTAATKYLLTGGAVTGSVSTYAQYDVAGNTVVAVDGRGNASTVSYADSFCNGSGCGGTYTPNTYAFPKSTTSPVPDPTGVYGSAAALVTSSVYDFWTGHAYSTTDANGKTTSFEYNDVLDRPTKVTRPDGGRTTVTYVTGHQCGDYAETRTLIDSSGRETDAYQFFDGLGRAYLAESYDGQDANNLWLRVDTRFDALGRVSQVSSPYRAYNCLSTANPSGRWTQTSYDALGRVTQVKTTADGAYVTTSYGGNKVTVTDQAGRKRRSVTDAVGRLVRVDEPDAATGALDGAGGSPLQPTYYAYDVLGNLRKVDQGGQLRFFMYDSLSRLIRAKNPEQGNFTPDAAGGDFPALTDSSSGTSNGQWSAGYAYDANGNLLKRRDARGTTAAYGYDALNRNTTVRYTLGGGAAATPDVNRYYDNAAAGANGLGRPYWTQTVGVSATVFDSYDAAGRPAQYHQVYWVNNAWGQYFNVSRSYDKAGDVTSQTYPSGHTVSYNYDRAGRLADNGTGAAFSGNIGDGVQRTYASQVRYHELGGMEQERFGTDTPVYDKHLFNSRGQLAEIRVSTYSILTAGKETDWNRGAVINHYSTAAGAWGATGGGPDNDGDLKKQDIYIPDNDQISGYSQSTLFFDYDYLNRLKQARESWGGSNIWVQNFGYDRWGNRTINAALTTGTAPEPQFTVDASTNRLGVPAGQGGVMTYDAAGNITNDTYQGGAGGGGTRAYDAEGRMTSAQFVSGQLQTATYTYDGGGRRVKRNAGAGGDVWQVYGTGGELLAEYAAGASPASPQKEYGYRSGELLVTAEPGAVVRWLVADQLGTPRMIVDKAGSLSGVKRHDYLPFGEEVAADASWRTAARGYAGDTVRQKFTGYERDGETGLDFAQARYFSNQQGRFTSPDPLLASAILTNPQTLNRYSYVNNNPPNLTDPLGMMTDPCANQQGSTGCYLNGSPYQQPEDDGQVKLPGDIGIRVTNPIVPFPVPSPAGIDFESIKISTGMVKALEKDATFFYNRGLEEKMRYDQAMTEIENNNRVLAANAGYFGTLFGTPRVTPMADGVGSPIVLEETAGLSITISGGIISYTGSSTVSYPRVAAYNEYVAETDRLFKRRLQVFVDTFKGSKADLLLGGGKSRRITLDPLMVRQLYVSRVAAAREAGQRRGL